MQDIVVGVDRSDTARIAAERAAELAAAYDTNLHVVMCVERRPNQSVSVGTDVFDVDWMEEAARFVGDVAKSLPHDQVTHTVLVADPADGICAEATRIGARAIVVGNRRVQGMSRVLGSVASAICRHAPCDVVVANTAVRDRTAAST